MPTASVILTTNQALNQLLAFAFTTSAVLTGLSLCPSRSSVCGCGTCVFVAMFTPTIRLSESFHMVIADTSPVVKIHQVVAWAAL